MGSLVCKEICGIRPHLPWCMSGPSPSREKKCDSWKRTLLDVCISCNRSVWNKNPPYLSKISLTSTPLFKQPFPFTVVLENLLKIFAPGSAAVKPKQPSFKSSRPELKDFMSFPNTFHTFFQELNIF